MERKQQKIKVVITTTFLLFTIFFSNTYAQKQFLNQELDYDNDFESRLLSQFKMDTNFKDYFEKNKNPSLTGLLKANKIEGKPSLIDSIVSSAYDTLYQWIKYSYKYDNNGYMIESLGEYTDDGIKGYFTKLYFKVLSDGKLGVYLQLIWENGSWLNKGKITNTYDSAGNKILTVYEVWDRINSTWFNNSRDEYSYDVDNNLIQKTNEIWNGTSWDYSQKSNNRYDSNNNLVQKIVSNWDRSAWKYYLKFKYEYDPNNNKTVEISYSYYGGWLESMKSTYTYDSNNNNTSANHYKWDNLTNQWSNLNRSTYTYNSSGKILSHSNETWDGSNWVITYYGESTYDKNNNLLTDISYHNWDGNTWDSRTKQTFTYNSEGNCSTGKNEIWLSNHWVSNDGYFFIPGYTDQTSNSYFNYYTSGYEFTVYYQPTTDINEDNDIAPNAFSLSQNYPNPFNPSTKINYSLAKTSHVSIIIYNTIGQKVKELVNRYESAGNYEVEFNAGNLASGLYFYRLETPSYSKTMKMILLR